MSVNLIALILACGYAIFASLGWIFATADSKIVEFRGFAVENRGHNRLEKARKILNFKSSNTVKRILLVYAYYK